MSRSYHRQAYAMLLVIVTLLIAASSLIGLAKRNLDANARSLDYVAGLQSKWGRHSLELIAARNADSIFEQFDSQLQSGANPIFQVRTELYLSGHSYSCLLADENAKLQLSAFKRNLAQGLAADVALQNAIMTLVPHKYLSLFRLGWQQRVANGSVIAGDIVDFRKLNLSTGDARTFAELTKFVSFWGQGTTNVKRAPKQVLVAQCQAALPKGQADSLVEEILRLRSRLDLPLLLDKRIQDRKSREKLGDLLGTESGTFSIWTESTSPKSHRIQSLLVRSVDVEGNIKTHRMRL